jgi:hypothetical protein
MRELPLNTPVLLLIAIDNGPSPAVDITLVRQATIACSGELKCPFCLIEHGLDRSLTDQGLGACGSGLGGLILSNTTRITLERFGVKWSLIINGLISFVVLVPVVFLMKGRHAAVKARQAPFEVKWFVHPGFCWVLLWGPLSRKSLLLSLHVYVTLV